MELELLIHFLAGLVILAVIFALTMALWFMKTLKPTTGRPIARYDNPRPALLVVDIQEDLTGTTAHSRFGYKDAEPFIATVNRCIASAAARGLLVIYIGHECPDTLICRLAFCGRLLQGGEGTRQDDRLAIVSDHYFTKELADAFSSSHMEEFLIENQVDEVFVVGLDAVGCAYKTALGAVNRGYRTTIILDAVRTMRKKTADQLAALYHKSGIGVTDSASFIGK
jgi:nicotinamidase/pyrazinamidase